VWEILPQVNQRDDQPVDEHQPMPGTGPAPRSLATSPVCRVTVALDHGCHGPANSSTKQAGCRREIPVNS